MKQILNKITSAIETFVKTYPSHLFDESLIKHKIVEILLDEIEDPFKIENLQTEKTCKISNVSRCDIFFQNKNKNIFLELKLNRLVLKLNTEKLTGGNVFSSDILAILKDFDNMRLITNGEKYLLLLMQNQGVSINDNYKLSLNEYCEKVQTEDSNRLMGFFENRNQNAEVIKDEIIQGNVNGVEIPFRLLIFKVK